MAGFSFIVPGFISLPPDGSFKRCFIPSWPLFLSWFHFPVAGSSFLVPGFISFPPDGSFKRSFIPSRPLFLLWFHFPVAGSWFLPGFISFPPDLCFYCGFISPWQALHSYLDLFHSPPTALSSDLSFPPDLCFYRDFNPSRPLFPSQFHSLVAHSSFLGESISSRTGNSFIPPGSILITISFLVAGTSFLPGIWFILSRRLHHSIFHPCRLAFQSALYWSAFCHFGQSASTDNLKYWTYQ